MNTVQEQKPVAFAFCARCQTGYALPAVHDCSEISIRELVERQTKAGVRGTDIARSLGISRQRVYQIQNGE